MFEFDAAGEDTIELRAESNWRLWSVDFSQLFGLKKQSEDCSDEQFIISFVAWIWISMAAEGQMGIATGAGIPAFRKNSFSMKQEKKRTDKQLLQNEVLA